MLWSLLGFWYATYGGTGYFAYLADAGICNKILLELQTPVWKMQEKFFVKSPDSSKPYRAYCAPLRREHAAEAAPKLLSSLSWNLRCSSARLFNSRDSWMRFIQGSSGGGGVAYDSDQPSRLGCRLTVVSSFSKIAMWTRRQCSQRKGRGIVATTENMSRSGSCTTHSLLVQPTPGGSQKLHSDG